MNSNYLKIVQQQWGSALNNRKFILSFLLNFLFCFSLYFLIIHWLLINSTHAGATITDPLQNLFIPFNLSPYIGILTYSASLAFILYVAQYPQLLHRVFQSFTAVFVVRAICIFLLPLSPPVGMIPLYDPVSDYIGNESKILNDLFFSGHIADLSIFFFATQQQWLKRWLGSCIVLVGAMMIVQRVHYSADVFCAVLFAYACHKIFVNNVNEFTAQATSPAFAPIKHL